MAREYSLDPTSLPPVGGRATRDSEKLNIMVRSKEKGR